VSIWIGLGYKCKTVSNVKTKREKAIEQ
jgi:hypothetical protein